jgi:hypothetical protein
VAAVLDDTTHATIDVWLVPYDYRKSFDTIRVIGDFNNFAYDSGVVMERGDDGCYYAEISSSKPIKYQLLGIANDGPVSAPQCAGFTFHGASTYQSVGMPRMGKVTIVFDSTQARGVKAKAHAVFQDPQMEALANIYGDMLARREAYTQGLTRNREAGRSLSEFKYNWSRDVARIDKQLADEEDTVVRGMLYISMLDLGTLGATSELRPEIAKEALTTVPPTSPLWSANPKLIPLAIERSGEPDSVYQDYVVTAIKGHGDPEVTSLLLYDGLTVAYSAKQTDKAQEYYNRLLTQFSSSRYAAMARVQFAMARTEAQQ